MRLLFSDFAAVQLFRSYHSNPTPVNVCNVSTTLPIQANNQSAVPSRSPNFLRQLRLSINSVPSLRMTRYSL